MTEYIDKSTLKEWIAGWFEMNRYYHPYSKGNTIPTTELYDLLDRIPTIAPKHGRWVKDNGPYSLYKCSACNDYCTIAGWANCISEERMYKGFKYCPNCGAQMIDEVGNEAE